VITSSKLVENLKVISQLESLNKALRRETFLPCTETFSRLGWRWYLPYSSKGALFVAVVDAIIKKLEVRHTYMSRGHINRLILLNMENLESVSSQL